MAASPPACEAAPLRLVVTGGAGQGRIATALAGHLGLAYLDGDALGSAACRGRPRPGPTAGDRARCTWLDRVAEMLDRRGGGLIVACADLCGDDRHRLRTGTRVRLLFVVVEPASAGKSRPGRAELDVIAVPPDRAILDIVGEIARRMAGAGGRGHGS